MDRERHRLISSRRRKKGSGTFRAGELIPILGLPEDPQWSRLIPILKRKSYFDVPNVGGLLESEDSV